MTVQSVRSNLTRKVLFALLGSLALILAACSSGGGTTPGGSTGGTPSTTLRVVPAPATGVEDFFNPYFNTNGGAAFGAQGLLYEPLVYANLLTGDVKPWLASSWAYDSTNKVLTLHLNPAVKFNDGSAFTSADVVYTFDLMKATPALDQTGVMSLITGYAATDPETVTFTLKNVDSNFLFGLGNVYIVSKASWSTNTGSFTTFKNDQKPVGTGPYTLASYNASVIQYQVNPTYWGGAPAVKTIDVPAIKDNTTAIEDMDSGNLDWMGTGWSPSLDPSFVGKDPSTNHTWFAASNTVMLYLNLDKAPFNNLLVRQAINAAINRSQLPQGVAEYAKVANETGIITTQEKNWVTSQYAGKSATFSTSTAAQYMTQAGYVMGKDGFFQKNGQDITFTMDVVNGWNDWDQDTAYISQGLIAAGFDVSVNTQSGFTPYYNAITGGSYDAALSWTNGGPNPYFTYYGLLDSTFSAAAGGSATQTNFERWDATTGGAYAKETDTDLANFTQATTPAAQQAAIADIENVMVSQLPVLPLTVNVYWDEYTTQHWTGWPDQTKGYDLGSPYQAPDYEHVILNLKPAA